MSAERPDAVCEPATSSIVPLRKKNLDGTLYRRDAKIEAKLRELLPCAREELITRCAIDRRDDPGYVPSECLVYFLRANRGDPSGGVFEQLYRLLADRIVGSLPVTDGANRHQGEPLGDVLIREKVFDRFHALLAEDCDGYSERLDFWEIRFDQALARRRLDAERQVWRDAKRSARLSFDEDTNEPSEEVEKAAGSFDPFAREFLDAADYRFRLDAAIDTLPLLQRRILEMLRQGIPIDSKDSGAVTIAKSLGKSEKTIRLHRDAAYASLRATLRQDTTP